MMSMKNDFVIAAIMVHGVNSNEIFQRDTARMQEISHNCNKFYDVWLLHVTQSGRKAAKCSY
jgi:hypothetical protein